MYGCSKDCLIPIPLQSVSSVARSYPTLCDQRTATHQASPSITNLRSLLTHVHWVSDAIQPSHPLPSVGELKQRSDPHLGVSESQEKHLRLRGKQLICDSLNGSKITADDDCSHEIKRLLLLGRKALLCLKLYSWCIRGERCIPRPPATLPSCSSSLLIVICA